jgi:AcrR family transcriptional regulator
VLAAIAIIDERGADALTTTAVARRLDVTQPAIYSHVPSVEALRGEVARAGIQMLSNEVREATEGLVGDDALRALATAYRRYVRRHPGLYLFQLRIGGTEALAAESADASEPVRSVLRSYGLTEARVRETHLLLRAAVHGFVNLEAQGLLGAADADRSFTSMVELFRQGLHATERTH